jgi:hypothetical protein
MPSDTIDFDPRNSDLQVGLEVEYPIAESRDEYLVGRGHDSNHIQSRVESWPSTIGGRAVYDGTVGLEVVSDVLDLEDAPNWYREVIDHVEGEYGARYQPTGLMSNGSTAGLHVHISSLSEDQARDLADLSTEPWAQVLFCSSIATNGNGEVSWPVFRGGQYCQMGYGSNHYNVVNSRGRGHFEWRLVEPMVPGHVEVLMEFLRAFEQSTEAAIEYAQEALDDVDDRITSVQRAEAIGMDMESVPTVQRQEAAADPENFYETIESNWQLPQIYTVNYDGTEYYTFDSRLSGVMSVEGVEFHTEDVLYADSLQPVDDETLEQEVRTALNRRGDTGRETEATEELKKVLKKKK